MTSGRPDRSLGKVDDLIWNSQAVSPLTVQRFATHAVVLLSTGVSRYRKPTGSVSGADKERNI